MSRVWLQKKGGKEGKEGGREGGRKEGRKEIIKFKSSLEVQVG